MCVNSSIHHGQATGTPVVLGSGWARPAKIHAKSRVYKAMSSKQKSPATTEKVIQRLTSRVSVFTGPCIVSIGQPTVCRLI